MAVLVARGLVPRRGGGSVAGKRRWFPACAEMTDILINLADFVSVTPAEAGVQGEDAGEVSGRRGIGWAILAKRKMDSRVRGNDGWGYFS